MKLQILLFTLLILGLMYSCQNKTTKQVVSDKQDSTAVEKNTLVKTKINNKKEETPWTNPEKYTPEEHYLYIPPEQIENNLKNVVETFVFSSGRKLKITSSYKVDKSKSNIGGLLIFDENKDLAFLGFGVLELCSCIHSD